MTDNTHKFQEDDAVNRALENTVRLSDINHNEFDAAFFPGGYGQPGNLVGRCILESFRNSLNHF